MLMIMNKLKELMKGKNIIKIENISIISLVKKNQNKYNEYNKKNKEFNN